MVRVGVDNIALTVLDCHLLQSGSPTQTKVRRQGRVWWYHSARTRREIRSSHCWPLTAVPLCPPVPLLHDFSLAGARLSHVWAVVVSLPPSLPGMMVLPCGFCWCFVAGGAASFTYWLVVVLLLFMP